MHKRTDGLLAAALAVIQVVDIVIHAGSNQLEPSRVLSNGLILLWVALVVSGRLGAWFLRASAALVGGYVVLNLAFLLTEGTVNPTNDQPRVALFVLVGLTVVLSSAIITRQRSQAGL